MFKKFFIIIAMAFTISGCSSNVDELILNSNPSKQYYITTSGGTIVFQEAYEPVYDPVYKQVSLMVNVSKNSDEPDIQLIYFDPSEFKFIEAETDKVYTIEVK